MAPLPHDVVTIFPWEMFTAYGVDGLPLAGGRLWTFVAETTTPKASFADRFFVTPNANPVVLNADGQAVVWLDGFYHLRLEDADGVLLWDVPSYTFATGVPPMPPGSLITGSTDATVSASPGAPVLTVPGLVPLGYRCLGLTWTITETFGVSNGLIGLALGDATLLDRWGQLTTLDAGQTGGQLGFHDASAPMADLPYVVLVSALGGPFDATGDLHLTAHWQALPADAP